MQTTWSLFVTWSRSFYSIVGLTVGLTCAMFFLLWIHPERPVSRCHCGGRPKDNGAVNRQLLIGPNMLYSVLPPTDHPAVKPCID